MQQKQEVDLQVNTKNYVAEACVQALAQLGPLPGSRARLAAWENLAQDPVPRSALPTSAELKLFWENFLLVKWQGLAGLRAAIPGLTEGTARCYLAGLSAELARLSEQDLSRGAARRWTGNWIAAAPQASMEDLLVLDHWEAGLRHCLQGLPFVASEELPLGDIVFGMQGHLLGAQVVYKGGSEPDAAVLALLRSTECSTQIKYGFQCFNTAHVLHTAVLILNLFRAWEAITTGAGTATGEQRAETGGEGSGYSGKLQAAVVHERARQGRRTYRAGCDLSLGQAERLGCYAANRGVSPAVARALCARYPTVAKLVKGCLDLGGAGCRQELAAVQVRARPAAPPRRLGPKLATRILCRLGAYECNRDKSKACPPDGATIFTIAKTHATTAAEIEERLCGGCTALLQLEMTGWAGRGGGAGRGANPDARKSVERPHKQQRSILDSPSNSSSSPVSASPANPFDYISLGASLSLDFNSESQLGSVTESETETKTEAEEAEQEQGSVGARAASPQPRATLPSSGKRKRPASGGREILPAAPSGGRRVKEEQLVHKELKLLQQSNDPLFEKSRQLIVYHDSKSPGSSALYSSLSCFLAHRKCREFRYALGKCECGQPGAATYMFFSGSKRELVHILNSVLPTKDVKREKNKCDLALVELPSEMINNFRIAMQAVPSAGSLTISTCSDKRSTATSHCTDWGLQQPAKRGEKKEQKTKKRQKQAQQHAPTKIPSERPEGKHDRQLQRVRRELQQLAGDASNRMFEESRDLVVYHDAKILASDFLYNRLRQRMQSKCREFKKVVEELNPGRRHTYVLHATTASDLERILDLILPPGNTKQERSLCGLIEIAEIRRLHIALHVLNVFCSAPDQPGYCLQHVTNESTCYILLMTAT
eukprot:g67192.t1